MDAIGTEEAKWYCPECGSGVSVEFTPARVEKEEQKTGSL